jgi:FtsH-binding integral membrane protein
MTYAQVRPLLKWVYVWMAFGLVVTAATAFFTTTSPALLALAGNPLVVFGSLFAQIGLVLAINFGINRMSPGVAGGLFIAYAALNGFVFGLILMFFTAASVFAAFATTAILFGIMTIIGFTTNMDLTRFGNLLMMAVIGLFVAIIVNMFLGSGILNFIISVVGVLIFMGLTAYDTQNLKRMAADPILQADGTMVAKMSIFGALALYINFINIFLFLLQLMGGGSQE